MCGGARGGGARGGGTARAAWHGRQRPGRDARVRTVAGGTGSLTSRAWMVAGGHGACVGQPGKEMEWAEPV
jgi:hypothetical protein